MRTIDILTTQNVTINYELADAKDRIFATIIDYIIEWLAIFILSLIFIQGFGMHDDYFQYVFSLPIIFFYFFVSEVVMDGQTIGKKILSIKVVKLTGEQPSINDYLMRWALRPVDVLFSLGSIGILMVSSSDKAQRLGDIIANTTVIKLNPTQRLQLNDLLKIRTTTNHEPTYPQVRNFTEPEMLLLKEVMDKSLKYRNDSHEEALEQACQLVKQRLHLEKIPADRATFIRTLIKDYVALSR
ncbi:MAG: RDD family protein [Bacteroidetes bacterium]|nr:RDD family protein [Bacteroidota bacterium]MBK8344124.1 RDD family protein [Bacteroidota bacterium]